MKPHINKIALYLSTASLIYACNSGGGTANSSPSSSGGSVSIVASQIPANFGNRGNLHDLTGLAVSTLSTSGESNSVIIGYNPSISSMSNQQCYNYIVTPGGVSMDSSFSGSSLSNTLEKNFAIGASAAGTVSTFLKGDISASFSADASSTSLSSANTYVYQLSYPLAFSISSLNSIGIGQTSAEAFGLNCGSNVITATDGVFTVLIEISANSTNQTDSENFNEAITANISDFVSLAEAVGVVNKSASSSASVQVSATIIGGNSTSAQILNAIQESSGTQCLSSGSQSSCQQWNEDINSAVSAAQTSITNEVYAGNISSLHFNLSNTTSLPVNELLSAESISDPFSSSSPGLNQLAKVIRTLSYINLKVEQLMDQIENTAAYQFGGNYSILNGLLQPDYAIMLNNLKNEFNSCLQQGSTCSLTSQTLTNIFKNYSGESSAANQKYLQDNFFALQSVAYYVNYPQVQEWTMADVGSVAQCQNLYMVGQTLYGQCQAYLWIGGWNTGVWDWQTSNPLSLTSCANGSGIWNNNGNLNCDVSNTDTRKSTTIAVSPIVVENTESTPTIAQLLVFNSQAYFNNNSNSVSNNGTGLLFPNTTNLAGLYESTYLTSNIYNKSSSQLSSYISYTMNNQNPGCNMQTNSACAITLNLGANCSLSAYAESIGYYCVNGTNPVYYQPSQVHIEYNSMIPPYLGG